MRVLPIIFNTDMVRAILGGRKTVTRRTVKPQPEMIHSLGYCISSTDIKDIGKWGFGTKKYGCHCRYVKPPYELGDILYVRETWSRLVNVNDDGVQAGRYVYKASDNYPFGEKYIVKFRWHPSIHMPKAAARIWLRVTDVRVERLQEITETQVEAECIPDESSYPIAPIYCPTCKGEGQVDSYHPDTLGYIPIDCPDCNTAIKRFANLWDSTIKKSDLDRYGWDASPWVWVIEFERCGKTEEENNG